MSDVQVLLNGACSASSRDGTRIACGSPTGDTRGSRRRSGRQQRGHAEGAIVSAVRRLAAATGGCCSSRRRMASFCARSATARSSTHGDMRTASDPPAINELVVGRGGIAYAQWWWLRHEGGRGVRPGMSLVDPDGSARRRRWPRIPNGMLTTPTTDVIVAESLRETADSIDIADDGRL